MDVVLHDQVEALIISILSSRYQATTFFLSSASICKTGGTFIFGRGGVECGMS